MRKGISLAAFLLSFCVISILLPLRASASDVKSGACGKNATWSYNEAQRTFTVSGSGDMSKYDTAPQQPWYAISGDVEEIVISEGITSIGDAVFAGFDNAKAVIIPSTVKEIGNNAFYGCSALSDVNIPNSVKKIGNNAFNQCSSLRSIIIPDSVNEIGTSVFYFCENLSNVKLSAAINEIPTFLFAGCALEYIELPSNINFIRDHAFTNCDNLKSITIPKSIISIGEGAFSLCDNLESAVISEGVESIGKAIFRECKNLKSISLPNSIATIPHDAFYGCGKLVEIVIPDSISSIGMASFLNCTSLQEIAIPYGVQAIESSTFLGCSNLRKVKIPDSVTEIGMGAFYECDGLTEIDYSGSKEQWDKINIDKENGRLLSVKINHNAYTPAKNQHDDNSISIKVPISCTGPITSSNRNANNYRWRYHTIHSYLYSEEKTITRVEHINNKVVVENYDKSNFEYISGWLIEPELPIWGGFYAGEKFNFLIFGQENPDENDAVEVMRVVKYDKSWNRLGHASVKASDTRIPFDAGTLRCTERDGNLFVYTCHEMYTDTEGLNHQSSFFFSVRQSDMRLDLPVYGYNGRVSHSLNQFIITDSNNQIIMLNHGDAYPRSAVMINYDTGKEAHVKTFTGEKGENTTGCSVGGLAETTYGYVAGYSYRDYHFSGYENFDRTRNLFLAFVPKNNYSSSAVKTWDSGKVTGSTPIVASASLDDGYMIWYNSNGLNYIHYNAWGDVSEIINVKDASMSDCEPIRYGDGVAWYVTDGSTLSFYTLDNSGLKCHPILFDSSAEIKPEPIGDVAYESTQKIEIDGKSVEFQMYALKDTAGNLTNYVRVRDIAYNVNGTKAQFNVGYNGKVKLYKNSTYIANGSEMDTPFGGDKAYTKGTQTTLVNGKPVDMDTIILTDSQGGGYTYYRLRDLGASIGFNVSYSAARGIYIETNKAYDASN